MINIIKIEINDEIIKHHLEECNALIKHKLYIKYIEENKNKRESYNKLLRITKDKNNFIKLLKWFDNKFNDIITGDLDKINDLIIEFEKVKYRKELSNKYNDIILDIFSYNTFSNRKLKFDDLNKLNCDGYKNINWCPDIYEFKLGVKICPYCNIEYIRPIISKSGRRRRGDLDHFIPKNEYPWLSMSIYNLVPSCLSCNRSVKTVNSINRKLSPFNISYNDYFKFVSNGYLENDYSIDIKINDVEDTDINIKEYLDDFIIKDIYQMFSDIVKEFYIKQNIYNECILLDLSSEIYKMYDADKFICNNSNELNNSVEKNKRLDIIVREIQSKLLGFPYKVEDIKNEPLGKLKRDLAIQFGFIK